MLIVVLVIAMVLSVTISGFSRTMESQRLMTSITQLTNDLTYVSQLALRDNKTAFITFLRAEDKSMPEGGEQYRAWQFTAFDILTKRYIPIDAIHRLPAGIIISNHKDFSSALAQAAPSEHSVTIGFRPDGSTTLPKDKRTNSSLTLVLERDMPATQNGKLPKNSRSVLINPHTGNIATY